MNQPAAEQREQVVITGLGVVSPIGIGRASFWQSLLSGTSGVGYITQFDASSLPVAIAAEVRDFDPKRFVRPRKNLKVMARDTQFAMAAVELACEDARLDASQVDPDRCGVVFGADRIRNELDEIASTYRACLEANRFDFRRWPTAGAEATYPLLMLKNLPNMLASHISIAKDARGPNNTICSAEVSGLLAVAEAASIIARGVADVVFVGASASRFHPLDWVRSCMIDALSRRRDSPQAASRPFDQDRDGQVRGEGAAALVLESRNHALRRGAAMLAQVAGWGAGFDTGTNGSSKAALGICFAIQSALRQAGLEASAIGHVNAHGLSTVVDDRREAAALASILPEVPVFAPKSYFGNLGAASGAVELAASVLAIAQGVVPMSLNCERPDPQCPVSVIRDGPCWSRAATAIVVNRTTSGQAAAVLITAAD
jgi:3-oxoacyl-[acyl-carrier-protein] synthase II